MAASYPSTHYLRSDSLPKKKNNPGKFVTAEQCNEKRTQDAVSTSKWRNKIDLALWGSDGRGGMVKDIGDMKKDVAVATSLLRSLVLPIVIPLAVGGIMYLLGKGAL
jgi:hypothetical protein